MISKMFQVRVTSDVSQELSKEVVSVKCHKVSLHVDKGS